MATTAHINRIAVGVPPHDVHQAFLHFTETLFRRDSGTLSVFRRMAERSGIEHRYSCLPLTPDWKTGLPMRYNPIRDTDEELADYRGSVVDLAPGTAYEVQLTLSGTATTTTVKASTWSETFPVGEVVRAADGDKPLAIKDSGTPAAWRVYDGKGVTIDVRHQHDACITIDASYVIVRGFTLKGAGMAGTTKPLGAITILPGRRDALDQPRAREVRVRLVRVEPDHARQRHEHKGGCCSHMHV